MVLFTSNFTMQQSAAIQNGISQYYQPKPQGDIDLTATVRQLLVEAGLLQNVLVAFDNHRFVLESIGKPSNVQRFLMNRYWNQQLMVAPVPSIEERYCLIPDGTVENWLTFFRGKVLPFIISNNLPMVI